MKNMIFFLCGIFFISAHFYGSLSADDLLEALQEEDPNKEALVLEQLKVVKSLIKQKIYSRQLKDTDRKKTIALKREANTTLKELIEKNPQLKNSIKAQLLEQMMILQMHWLYDLKVARDCIKKILVMNDKDAPKKLKLRALNNLTICTGPHAQFNMYHLGLKDEKDIAELQKDYEFAVKEAVKLAPENPTTRMQEAKYYIDKGDWKKAEKSLQIALKQETQLGDAGYAMLYRLLCDVAVMKGDKKAAIRYANDYFTNGKGKYLRITRTLMEAIRNNLDGYNLDFLKLPWYTGGKAFPEPQKAIYQEKFVPVDAVKLVLGEGLNKEDIRIELIRQKFKRFGIKINDSASFVIKINAGTSLSVPDKPEAYALKVTEKEAIIESKSKAGITWGIVSLIQLFDRSKDQNNLRLCEIEDYPVLKNRGIVTYHWKHALEYALFCKMNFWVAHNSPQFTKGQAANGISPAEWAATKANTKKFADFGIQYYYGLRGWTMHPKLPLSSERTFKVHKDLLVKMGKMNAGAFMAYDDGRFPLPAVDVDKFKTAANMDAPYLNRLFKAVKAEAPEFEMIFCPPFYWGPSEKAAYSEPREPYLKSIRKHLDPRVQVNWTGPRCRSTHKPKETVEWFTKLTGRKPTIFQNYGGPHMYCSYVTDAMPQWAAWHYDGFLNDLEGFIQHSTWMNESGPMDATIGDYFWNPKAYNPERSIRMVCNMLYGKGMFEILDKANKALAYIDAYGRNPQAYQKFDISGECISDYPIILKNVEIVNEALAEAKKNNPEAMNNFTGSFKRNMSYAKDLIKRGNDLKFWTSSKSPYAPYISDSMKLAAEDKILDLANKNNTFISPVEFRRGQLNHILLEYTKSRKKKEKPLTCTLFGNKTKYGKMEIHFKKDKSMEYSDLEFIVRGRNQHPEDKQCKIRVTCNGKKIFEGENTLKSNPEEMSTQKFKLPPSLDLQKQNIILIESLEDSDQVGKKAPAVIFNYGVILTSDSEPAELNVDIFDEEQ